LIRRVITSSHPSVDFMVDGIATTVAKITVFRRRRNPNDFVVLRSQHLNATSCHSRRRQSSEADQLTDDLRELAQRNGLNVRHSSFHTDMDILIRGLKGRLGGPTSNACNQSRQAAGPDDGGAIRSTARSDRVTTPSLRSARETRGSRMLRAARPLLRLETPPYWITRRGLEVISTAGGHRHICRRGFGRLAR
jgi:hypothetical protein